MKHCLAKAIIVFSFFYPAISLRAAATQNDEISPLTHAISLFEARAQFNTEDKKIIQLLPVIIEQIITKNNYAFTTKSELELMLNFTDLSHTLKKVSNKLVVLELITLPNAEIIPAIAIIKRAIENIIELEELETEPDALFSRACNTNALIDSIREKINSLRQLIIIEFNILESIIETIVVQNCCAELNSKLDILISSIDYILTASCDCP